MSLGITALVFTLSSGKVDDTNEYQQFAICLFVVMTLYLLNPKAK